MDERLKELQAKLANGEITQEQYNTMYNQISNPFEVDFVNDWMNAQLSNGAPLNIEQPSPVEPNYQQRLQDAYAGTGMNTPITFNPSPNPSEPTITSELNLPIVSGVESQDMTTYTPPAEKTTEGKKRSDFATDQEYYDYLKSRGVSDADISELNLKLDQKPTNVMDEFNKFIPFLNPYGSNIETELYSLGKFIGTEKGTPGRGLGIASSAVSAGLGGARTLLSGLAQQKQTELSAEEIRRQLAQRQFTPQTKYLNQNSRGGTTTY